MHKWLMASALALCPTAAFGDVIEIARFNFDDGNTKNSAPAAIGVTVGDFESDTTPYYLTGHTGKGLYALLPLNGEFRFRLTVADGWALKVTGLTFRMKQHSAGAVHRMRAELADQPALAEFGTANFWDVYPDSEDGLPLLWDSLDLQAGAHTFRLIHTHNPASNYLGVDEVALFGEVTPVPEPAALTLSLITAGGLLLRRRR